MIAQAKAEYVKKTLPPEKKGASGDSMSDDSNLSNVSGNVLTIRTVITEPNDSRFDLEAFLTMKMAEEAK